MAKRKISKVSEARAEQLYARVKAEPAGITVAQLDVIEARLRDANEGVTRRAALVALTRPAAFIFDAVKNDRSSAVAFASVAQQGHEYAKFLTSLAQLIIAACTRVDVALCIRADMQDVINEAKESSNVQD